MGSCITTGDRLDVCSGSVIRGPLLDVDAQTYIDAMVTTPNGARQTIINQFFLDIKGIGDFGTDNIFAQLDVLCLLAAHTDQAGLLDIKRNIDGVAVNSPVFTVDRGFESNGTSSYINSSFIPSSDGVNYTQNDSSAGIYLRENASIDAGFGGNSGGGTNGLLINARWSDNLSYFRINSLAADNIAVPDSLGFHVIRRVDSANHQLYRDGSQFSAQAEASGGLPSVDMYVIAANGNGTAAQFDTRQCCCYFFGAGLTATEQSNLNSALETYLDAIGAGVQ